MTKKSKLTRNERRLAKKEAKAQKKSRRIPRQNPLPGMEDGKLQAIENAALDYAELRDERQALTVKEVELKQKLIDLMHKHEKTEYKRNGISVKLVVEQEGVKVRVKDESDLPVPAPKTDVEVKEAEAVPF